MGVKAVIFDCFGVLLVAGVEMLRQKCPHVLKEIDEAFLSFDYGMISRQEFNKIFSNLTGVPSDEIESKYWGTNVRNDQIFDWIRELKQSGEYKIGMLSNVGIDTMNKFIGKDEQEELFDSVVLSGDVGVVKPDPQAFEMIASQMGVEPYECVMIDDRVGNIDGAARAGMRGIVYCTTHQTKLDFKRILEA